MNNKVNNKNKSNKNNKKTNVVASRTPTTPNALRAPRSMDTVIRAFSARAQNMNMRSDPYACCRLMGMVPKESPSIPDGGSGRHMCYCLYSTDTISGSDTFRLQFVPWLPTTCLATGFNTGFTVTDTSGSTTYSTPTLQSYPQLGRNPILQSSWGGTSSQRCAGQFLDDPWQSTTVRIVSQTHRLTYTGPAYSCAGVIQVFENAVSLAPAGNTSSVAAAPGAGLVSLTNYGSDGAICSATIPGTADINTQMYSLDGLTNPAPPPSTSIYRPEQGVMIRLKHRGNAFEPIPLQKQLIGVTAQKNTSPGAGLAAVNVLRTDQPGAFSGTTPDGTGLLAFDNDWVGCHLIASGLNADATYLLETCVCVELVPSASSPFAPLAKEASAPKPALIKMVDDTLREEGMSRPMK